jgi:hypothetical protein
MNAHSYSHSGYLPIVTPREISSALFGDSSQEEKLNNFLKAILKVSSSNSDNQSYNVTEKTLAIAINIAKHIPWNREYPKIGVDDGCIFMIWGDDIPSFAITIEGERIHLNLNPGSNSKHLEPLIYDSQYLPLPILQHIPKRCVH